MAKTVSIENLGEAISEVLTVYHDNVIQGIDKAGEKAIKELVKKTKATAPKKTGKFKAGIRYVVTESPRGNRYTWGGGRLTHLLVHGHATKNGGRTAGNPFLQNAMNEVLPEYEKDIEGVLKNGK